MAAARGLFKFTAAQGRHLLMTMTCLKGDADDDDDDDAAQGCHLLMTRIFRMMLILVMMVIIGIHICRCQGEVQGPNCSEQFIQAFESDWQILHQDKAQQKQTK